MPSETSRPRSWVPVGTTVPTPAARRGADGPASSARSAAAPMPGVDSVLRAEYHSVSPRVNKVSTTVGSAGVETGGVVVEPPPEEEAAGSVVPPVPPAGGGGSTGGGPPPAPG